MQIEVNGQNRDVAEGLTITGLLVLLDLRGRIAVEVNGDVVPRSAHPTRRLAAADRIEIVRAIGGG